MRLAHVLRVFGVRVLVEVDHAAQPAVRAGEGLLIGVGVHSEDRLDEAPVRAKDLLEVRPSSFGREVIHRQRHRILVHL